jgi:hypothetical protein
MDFIEHFQFEQSHAKASVAARLDSLELRMMLAPLAPTPVRTRQRPPSWTVP